MTQFEDKNNPDIHEGDVLSGCVVEEIAALDEIRAIYYRLRHEASGARFVHVSSDDKENTFSVAFKTVPRDSTGVAHILEHTVLCGSKRFPVRDPFFSMIKRSLNTFMNAFTASDWTMYPFCTQNRKDYYNLMEVYLDAAFFPEIALLNFKQEGHRLEFEPAPDDGGGKRLVYKGVVYNEMKGAMSSPDQVCQRSLLNALYPDTTYQFNSGGDPAVIPSLTHEALVAFHRRHYHPSNAFFYTYGNLPLKETLSYIVGKVLDRFSRIDPNTDVPSQPRWKAPRQATYYYPVGADEDTERKHQVCVGWLTADIRDPFEVLALTLLEDILLGNSAAPLRKALIDSGLGSALSDGTGFEPDNRDTLFACGLKDVAADAADAVEKVIWDTLTQLAEGGIDPVLIEGAIHQLEFRQKEITNTPYPYGLKLLMRFSGAWLHGGDPARHLKLNQDLDRLRQSLAAGGFFEGIIRKYFLENPHRIQFTLSPDKTLAEREALKLREELDRLEAGLSPEDVATIEADAAALQKLQETEEDLSSLPTLERNDIPPTINSVAHSPAHPNLGGTRYVQPTAGIFYFSALAGLGALEETILPWIPFFCYSFTKVGTKRHDYTEMARRMELYTGGVGLAVSARTRHDATGTCLPYLIFEGKCLERNIGHMMDILTETMGEVAFSNLDRLRRLLLEYRAGLDAMVIHNGHRLAMSMAARRFSRQTALSEMWSGIEQLRFVKGTVETLSDASLTELSRTLSGIRERVFVASNMSPLWIGEDRALTSAAGPAASLQACLGGGAEVDLAGPAFVASALRSQGPLPREGWYTASAVSFVARMFETVRLGHPDAAALSIIAKLIRSMYLHREIREKGGAYGGFSVYSSENGLFGFASYRDPHIVSTLKAFDGANEFICSGNFTDQDVKEALLQVCSELDRPDPPAGFAKKAFMRKFVSITDETRRRHKAALLAMTREQVIETARKYFGPNAPAQAVAVISGEENLKAANERLGEAALVLNKI